MKAGLYLCLGAAVMLGGVLMARGSAERKCLDVLDMSVVVDACLGGVEVSCDALERMSAKCLLDRAMEATEAKQFRFGEPMSGEVVP